MERVLVLDVKNQFRGEPYTVRKGLIDDVKRVNNPHENIYVGKEKERDPSGRYIFSSVPASGQLRVKILFFCEVLDRVDETGTGQSYDLAYRNPRFWGRVAELEWNKTRAISDMSHRVCPRIRESRERRSLLTLHRYWIPKGDDRNT